MSRVEYRQAPEVRIADPDPSALIAGSDLAIIVPTYNERDNIAELYARLKACLSERSWEVIFVDDDSPDGTADAVRKIAVQDRRVRCIQRIGRRGLSSACVEGMLSTSASYLAVIDADLQHDERLLPRMLEVLQQREADIVVGSRYAPGGGTGTWSIRRARMSRLASRISRILVPAGLTDPLSGFFMMRRSVFTECRDRLSSIGFKILADVFASYPRPLRFKELSYQFAPRRFGASKFDSVTAWDYAMLLLDKLVGHLVPVRFIAFSIVGAVGVAVHFTVLGLIFGALQSSFPQGQAIATVTTMTFNFAVNNGLTYSDRRLRGSRWLRGWASFMLACSIGALINVGLATSIYEAGYAWSLAAMGGIIAGAVWNYAATMFVTWGRPTA